MRSCWRVALRAVATSAAVLPSVHSRWRSPSLSSKRPPPRSAQITPYARPAALSGVQTSVVIPNSSPYSGGSTSSIRSDTTTTASSRSARCAIGAAISDGVGVNDASCLNEVPCEPTTRTLRRPASAMKIAARRIVVSLQIASQMRS